jgi:hypothetical protein
MDFDLTQTCDLHSSRWDCPDALITESDGVYGLIVHDGGSSAVRIAFCPWCGTQLSPVDAKID